MKLTYSDTFDCTPQVLWPWLDDPEKCKQWLKGLEQVKVTSSGPKGVGTTAKLYIREGGKLQEYDETVLLYEPGRRFKMQMVGGCLRGAAMIVDYRLTDLGGRTRVDYECEAQTDSFFMKLMSPLFAIFGRMQIKSFFRKLKTLVASGGLAPAS